jgi:hypothetical protein
MSLIWFGYIARLSQWGRRGVISSFKWFLPAFATCRGRGEGVGTLCIYNLPNQTCQTKLAKRNPCMYSNSDYFVIAVHHWFVSTAAQHLPNQTCQTKPLQCRACILTQTISYCSPSLACSSCCFTPAKPNPCMYINPDYFLWKSIIGLFLLLPYTCQAKLCKPNPCMYLKLDYFLLQSIIGLFLLLPYTWQTKLSQPNPCMYINSDHFLLRIHH